VQVKVRTLQLGRTFSSYFNVTEFRDEFWAGFLFPRSDWRAIQIWAISWVGSQCVLHTKLWQKCLKILGRAGWL